MPNSTNRKSRKRAKRKKMILTLVVVWTLFVLAAIAVWRFVVKPMLADNEKDAFGLSSQQGIYGVQVGDTLTFGRYEQDADEANGKEPIEWIILEKKGKTCLLISKYALDCQRYQKYNTQTTWESADLRKWLNNDYLSTAFSADEQQLIRKTTVTADANPYFQKNVGNDTKDKIFCLSIVEANKFFSSDELRKCIATEHAITQGPSFDDDYYIIEKDQKEKTVLQRDSVSWWLRTTGAARALAAYVRYIGTIDDRGTNIARKCYVRPAMWIVIG